MDFGAESGGADHSQCLLCDHWDFDYFEHQVFRADLFEVQWDFLQVCDKSVYQCGVYVVDL